MAPQGKMTKALKTKTSKKKKNFKFGKKDKKDFKPFNKRGRLIVRNLPFKCTEKIIRKHFAPYGEIININLLKRVDGKLVGCGFVEYSNRLNADKATQALNGQELLGRPLFIERAVARDRFGRVQKEVEDNTLIKEDEIKEEIKEPMLEDDNEKKDILISDIKNMSVDIKEEVLSSEEKSDNSDESSSEDEDEEEMEEDEDEEESEEEEDSNSPNKQKQRKNKNKNLRKARLIVRNLSFKSTEEKLKEHFKKYGDVVDVQLLRRDDNKLVGCGFIQFAAKQSAAKAIHHTSGQPFLDRPIIVDWAVPKSKFKDLNNPNTTDTKSKIKQETDDEEKIKKEESETGDEKENTEIKDENTEESDVDVKSESESTDDDEDEEEVDGEDSSDEDEKKPCDRVEDTGEPDRKKRRFESNDVSEGKTVFLKNVPFSVTNDELKKCMLQFGPVYYALVCVDKLTEHSKGTAFVKFKEVESAEKCLSSGTELALKGVVLDPHPALKHNDATNKKDSKPGQKDNRNLYLVKEGVILAGTPAARDVSQTDMQRRLQLEQWKTQMLRNLNMFVARGRLIVHNLPLTYDDAKLRNLFKKHVGSKGVIREARVMRDLKNVDDKGIGISKGFGFVSFTEHEDALRALRSINNNPDIFTKSKRPIVAFSIENRAVLNAKTKRTMKSKQNNPLYKGYTPPVEKKDENNEKKISKKNQQELETKPNHKNPKYIGTAATPGSKKLRTKFNLKTEAAIHLKESKKLKHSKKLSRKFRTDKKDFASKREAQDQKFFSKKKKIDQEETNFTNIYKRYKNKVTQAAKSKQKWYDK